MMSTFGLSLCVSPVIDCQPVQGECRLLLGLNPSCDPELDMWKKMDGWSPPHGHAVSKDSETFACDILS